MLWKIPGNVIELSVGTQPVYLISFSAHILPIDIFLLFLCVFCIHILFRTSFYFASVRLINVCNNLYAWSNFDLDWCIQWTVFALVYACCIILNNIQAKKLSYYWKCIKYFFSSLRRINICIDSRSHTDAWIQFPMDGTSNSAKIRCTSPLPLIKSTKSVGNLDSKQANQHDSNQINKQTKRKIFWQIYAHVENFLWASKNDFCFRVRMRVSVVRYTYTPHTQYSLLQGIKADINWWENK